ncbi:MAG TPA: TRAM domain-containing protein [Bacillota bacterium]|nr:TRAM domain-containing protein [Bacillota bacterium]
MNWRMVYWITVGGVAGYGFSLFQKDFGWKIPWILGGMVAGGLGYKFILKQIIGFFTKMSGQELLVKAVGLIFGLSLSALLSVIFKPFLDSLALDEKVGFLLLLFLLTTGISGMIASTKAREFQQSFLNRNDELMRPVTGSSCFKILDTSAIIDGRIADLCKTGFLEGVLIVPNFVVGELQKIADSADTLRRNRGRRGLDLLNKMQKENQVTIKIFDRDYGEINEVDTKLLKLAREMDAKVITNDFNLNKVAELYGVQVLNINELSNAIKPLVLPGEEMTVHVLRDGKEYGQGIGYLDDGTMIVVEGGRNYIGLDIEVLVTSVLQTSAGRMIFAKPKEVLMVKVTS